MNQLYDRPRAPLRAATLGPGKGTHGSSSLYVGDQNRRIFLRSAKPVAARVEREQQWSTKAVLPEEHRLVGAFASPSEQSGSAAKRNTTCVLRTSKPCRETLHLSF